MFAVIATTAFLVAIVLIIGYQVYEARKAN